MREFVSTRFNYVAYGSVALADQEKAKELCIAIEAFIENELKAGRATALALTKLEEVYMWIGKAIRNEQIEGPNNG